jgi:hypothetical protein
VDRAELSEAIIDDLGQLFVTVLKQHAATLVASDFDGIEQCLQEVGRQVLGPVVERTVAAIAAAQSGKRATCPVCHQVMRLVDTDRPRDLQGLVGDYTITRAYFFCDGCHWGVTPLDERLGLGGGVLSPGLERVACWFGIDDSFQEGADALHETLRITLRDEPTRRITEGIGAVAEAETQMLVARAQTGHGVFAPEEIVATSPVLLVEVDGALVHEIDGNWHEVKAGLAAPLGPAVETDPKTGRTTLALGNPSYCAGFEGAEPFWWRVYVEACRRGLGTDRVKLIVVLGDGADWIWRYAAAFLAVAGVQIIEIVDLYHALEHLGLVARIVLGQGSRATETWLAARKKELLEQGAAPILAALADLEPDTLEAAEEVRKGIGYFQTHAARMDYPQFIARQFPIGSGAIESTCKTLVEERAKGAGMRWTQAGAQAVLSLRAVQRSGRWRAFWKKHPQRRRPTVCARRPTKPTTVQSLERKVA